MFIAAQPMGFEFAPQRTALVMIDMQRDFIEPGGYGDLQCNSAAIFGRVSSIIEPCRNVLLAARALGLTIIHTREGHEPDLRDLPASKKLRQYMASPEHYSLLIGDKGSMGRLLVRGEYGHDIITDLQPLEGETVIDKPGKGTFYNTDIHQILVSKGITHLLLCGVTTECCVNTTFREANDHGFECCALTDCTDGFDADIVTQTVNTFCAYDGLLGYVGQGKSLVELAKGKEAQLATKPSISFSFPNSNLAKKLLNYTTKEPAEVAIGVDSGTASLVFVPSSGMVSLHGSQHDIFSSVSISSESFDAIRQVFADARGFDADDELSKQYFEYPIKLVDFRGVENHFQYASATNDVLPGTKVPYDFDVFYSTESEPMKLLKWKRKVLQLFQPKEAPHILVFDAQDESAYKAVRLLGLPSFKKRHLLLVGEFGLDGQLLDIASVI